ncbi:DUF4367 domain-containing protein [Paenibacillus sp. J5C_2022]|uniref:DUF4367 domain-containing protein n=1 Tax=Paenibacillus sp. J5C2022 TaxID=2977129 RepID=UPI0021D12FF4|nr:DUF4367 domain-containing protein [Paenibacillus sp. J5C2022]MCU6710490.1 DUF4367 domain-containing protein [Paenibacillus sp. J5C2022]
MFNSEKLTYAYKTTAANIQPGAGHEQRVEHIYMQYRVSRDRKAKPRRSALVKIALVAAVVALVTGFTGYYYLNISDQRISIEYKQSSTEWLDAEHSAEIYGMLSKVEASLEEGESAVVYIPSLAEVFPEQEEFSLLAVSEPVQITDVAAWQALVADYLGEDGYAPATLNDWTFQRGQEQWPFGGMISIELMNSLLPELKQESVHSGDGFVWRKVDVSGSTDSDVLTAYYRNSEQAELYVKMSIIEENTVTKMATSLSEAEEVDLGMHNAHYLRTEPFMYAASNSLQEVQWLDTKEHYTIVYGVGSTASDVTKKELINIAQELASMSANQEPISEGAGLN